MCLCFFKLLKKAFYFFCWQKWISNEKRKRAATKPTEPEDFRSSKQARLLTFKRGPSSYNVFCSEFFRSGKDSFPVDWVFNTDFLCYKGGGSDWGIHISLVAILGGGIHISLVLCVCGYTYLGGTHITAVTLWDINTRLGLEAVNQ